eukprot:5052027-Amphidinium_carterae.1
MGSLALRDGKAKGNLAVARGDFVAATEFYCMALQHADCSEAALLLSNRAQASIKLNSFADALVDAAAALIMRSNTMSPTHPRQGFPKFRLEEMVVQASRNRSGFQQNYFGLEPHEYLLSKSTDTKAWARYATAVRALGLESIAEHADSAAAANIQGYEAGERRQLLQETSQVAGTQHVLLVACSAIASTGSTVLSPEQDMQDTSARPAQALREEANECFRLGKYATARASYTKALAALPAS